MKGIPAGYKQTEVGVIPEDWDAPDLGDILKSMQLGGNYRNSERENCWPLIKMGNLGRGSIKLDKLEFIDSPQTPASRDRLNENDLLFNTRNTLDLVGKIAIWRSELPEAYYNSNIARMMFDERRVSSYLFMNYIMNTPRMLRELRSIAIGTTSVAAIYGRDLVKLRVQLPTKAEQEAIAEALSDTDAFIESLEQLIAKKRHLKQGAMQELLTGKKRLPGFQAKPGYKKTEVGMIPEDWNVKFLPEICRFRGGKAHEQFISELGQYACVNSKFISTEGVVRKYSTANFCCANKGDVLMVMSDLPNGKALAKAFLSDQDGLYAVNQRVCALTAYRDSPKFLFYILNRNPYFLQFDNGVSQTHLLNNVFAACQITLPPTKAEQTAIAAILSAMDAEIAALETKLAKTRQLKQGMMHNLLTGRIRLL